MSEDSISLPGPNEARLDALHARVDACDQHLTATAGQAAQLIRFRMDEMRESIRLLGATLRLASGTPTSDAADLQAAADALDRKLCARIVARADALEARRVRIEDAVSAFYGEVMEAHAGRRVAGPTLQALRRYQHAGDALVAELRIAAAIRRLLTGYRGRVLEERRRALTGHLRALRAAIDARRAALAAQRERSATLRRMLDDVLCAEIEDVGAALEDLLSGAAPTRGSHRRALARRGKHEGGTRRRPQPERGPHPGRSEEP